MERFGIPPRHWPFTLENAFPAAIRRQAMAEGAYAKSDELFGDLATCAEFAKRQYALTWALPRNDDAWLYLMAPTPEGKNAFSTWITDPARQRTGDYEAFRVVIERLRQLLDRYAEQHAGDARQAPLL
jgi:hypothetical protein